MPTALVLLANQLSQNISDVTIPFYFATWDARQAQWHYKKNPKRYRPYYLIIAGNILLILVCTSVIIISADLRLIPNKTLILCGLPLPNFMMSLLCDLMMTLYGGNFVTITNWIFATELRSNRNVMYREENNSRLGYWQDCMRLIVNDLRLAWRKEVPPDWIGLFLVMIAVSYAFGAFFFALFFSFARQDPVFLLYSFMDALQLLPIRLTSNLLATTVRHVLVVILYQAIMMNFRCFIMLTVDMAYSFLSLLRTIRRRRVSRESTDLYRKLYICYVAVRGLTDGIIGGMIVLLYVTVILGVNTAIAGGKTKNATIAGVAATLSLMMIFFSEFMFRIACYLLEFTQEILRGWKQETRGSRGGYFRRVVAGLKPMSLRMGNAATISRSMKMEYFNWMLDHTVGVMLINEELFGV